MKKIIISLVLFSFIFFPSLSFSQAPVQNATLPAPSSGGTGSGAPFQNANLPSPSNVSQSTASSSALLCRLSNRPTLGVLFDYITCILSKSVVPLIFTLAFVMFIWGVVQYVINDDEEAKKAKGKQFMIWGIIALAVMVSVWGLVSILGNTFGIDNVIPTLQ